MWARKGTKRREKEGRGEISYSLFVIFRVIRGKILLPYGIVEGHAEGKIEGHTEGLAEGREKEKLENACKMKALGFDSEKIHAVTALPFDVINTL